MRHFDHFFSIHVSLRTEGDTPAVHADDAEVNSHDNTELNEGDPYSNRGEWRLRPPRRRNAAIRYEPVQLFLNKTLMIGGTTGLPLCVPQVTKAAAKQRHYVTQAFRVCREYC